MPGSRHRGSLVAGVFFMVMGLLFLLDDLEILDLRPSILWPAVLIGLGLAILAGAVGRSPQDHER